MPSFLVRAVLKGILMMKNHLDKQMEKFVTESDEKTRRFKDRRVETWRYMKRSNPAGT